MKGIAIPSHSDILQSPASVESPEHWSLPPKSAPPQARTLSFDPSPQETLHMDHWPQSCHSAATAAVKLGSNNEGNMNKAITLALGCLATVSLRRNARTLLNASSSWFTTSTGSDFGPRATRGCALGPVAPVLPFGNCCCNVIR